MGDEQPYLRPRMKSADAIYRSQFRYPPYNLDALTNQKGYELADEMMTMGACRAPFNLKRMAIQSDGWEIVPAITDAFDSRYAVANQYSDFVQWIFDNMSSPSGYPHDMGTSIWEICRGMWDGMRVGELLPRYIEDGPYAGKIGLQGIAWKHARQIGFDYDPVTQEIFYITSYVPGTSGGLELKGSNQAIGGYDFQVPADSCIIYSYLPDAGIINSPGDWRPSYKHWYALDLNLRGWALALKRFGSPVIIASADSNNQQQMDAAATALLEFENGKPCVFPSNTKYEVVTPGANNVFDGYLKSNQWHEASIARVVHGSTLTTQEGEHGSTSAGSDTHQDTEETIYGYSRRTIEAAFQRQVIDRLMRYNIAGYDNALCPRLSLGGDKTDNILGLMQAFDLAINDGVLWKGEKWIRERLGFNPQTPEDQAAMQQEQEEQQKAEQEAAERLADAKNSGKTAKMSAVEDERAMRLITQAVKARMYVEANPGRLASQV
jgi:hypothetical protein